MAEEVWWGLWTEKSRWWCLMDSCSTSCRDDRPHRASSCPLGNEASRTPQGFGMVHPNENESKVLDQTCRWKCTPGFSHPCRGVPRNKKNMNALVSDSWLRRRRDLAFLIAAQVVLAYQLPDTGELKKVLSLIEDPESNNSSQFVH